MKCPEVVTINARPAYEAALNAARNNELQFQQPDNLLGSCQFAGPCAVGVSVPLSLRAAWDSEFAFATGAHTQGWLVTDNIKALADLQATHDRLAGKRARQDEDGELVDLNNVDALTAEFIAFCETSLKTL